VVIMTLQDALWMNLWFGTGLLLFIRFTSVRRVWARAMAVLLLTALAANYMVWRTRYMPDLDWSFGSLWPWAFFLFEVATVVYETWSYVVMIRTSDHSPEADQYEASLRRRSDLPTVDVYIATLSEPLDILELTIRAALRLDYPASLLQIYVLDDGDRPPLAALAGRLGVQYIARPVDPAYAERGARSAERSAFGRSALRAPRFPLRKLGGLGKAGNQQYAFERTQGQYIAMLDADFTLEPNFLYRTLGFLLDRPDLGVVQTPQHFRNPDLISYNLLAGDCVPEEQHFFMTVTQPCRDAWGNAFCVGTGGVVSRAALQKLGGFPRSTICEDLELSYALRTVGYQTLYLNERLAHGLAPEAIPEYLKQRIRWCTGTIQHLFIATGPFRGHHRLLDRIFYLEGFFYWFGFFFVALLILAPLVFWCTGVPAIAGPAEEALLVLLPRLTARALLIYWLSETKLAPIVINIGKVLPAFHLSATVIKALLSPFSATYKVTDKGHSRNRVVIRWPLFSGFLSIAGLGLLAMLLNLSGFLDLVPISELTPLNVTWTLFSSLVCLAAALACVELPKGKDYLENGTEVQRSQPAKIVFALVRRLLGFADPLASGRALAPR
jgi:cellulose synthase (UDP-forming)